MNARYLLGIALSAAVAVGACGGGDDGQLIVGGNSNKRAPAPKGDDTDTSTTNTPPPPAGTGTTPSGSVPTNSEAGKKDFEANVFPFLNTKCGGCHAGGIGNPTYIKAGDAIGTYALVYSNGFAVENSRIIMKGVHSGGGAPALTDAERTKWLNWLALEQSSTAGKPTQQNVLEKFGTCFDKAKFDAIGFQQLRTIRRQTGNNPQNLNENANNCTGCDNTPCYECHAAARATGFVMAYGAGAAYAPDFTFEQTKLLSPPYIRQYIGTDPTGAPVYNPGVKNKSINTVEKAKAYTHPMYKLTAAQEQGIQAFVQDAIDKYKAGTCGK